ncbi:hydrolase [Photobacterium angustum]|uniref:Hydrolase n=1 Tax=Photobacterium angustum TaxID=661 RepID=A0A2T3Q6Q4_PHOAN|nr:hydrolase [Photobacterium angustum]KJF95698.1 hydrolase [Photobacterium angustum]KJG05272.1 hydrolase [Photobacterium angustum]KJG17177.1 hydrolase [Photobacterium angustum]KJG23460.1 hydrolase [Photobacterium angustum]KJG30391.1 hydrolase [Photobacterium angustum]
MSQFTPASGLQNPHIQTLLPRFVRRQPLFTPVTQRLTTPDDDFLDLAWTESPTDDSKPLMILFHGLEGSFHSPYANGLLYAAKQQGWLGVMMHFRGCSGELNRQPRGYHSGEVNDARFFITWLREQFPQRPFIAVGVSLGGNMLINYLAKYGDDSDLVAAQAVSPPLNLASCSARIQQGFSKIYQQYLLSSMKRTMAKRITLHQDKMPITHQQLEAINTVWQFDQHITAPLHGFIDADDYYQRCSGLQQLNLISTPLRIIHAKDDPFMTESVIPSQPLPDNIDYNLYEKGGHVGFVSGSIFKPTFWLEHSVPTWFKTKLTTPQ